MSGCREAVRARCGLQPLCLAGIRPKPELRPRISLQKSTGSIDTAWSDDYPYQKHTAISPSGTAIVAGTTDDVVSVYSYPDLQGGQNLKMEHEVVDLHWGGEDGKTVSRFISSCICNHA